MYCCCHCNTPRYRKTLDSHALPCIHTTPSHTVVVPHTTHLRTPSTHRHAHALDTPPRPSPPSPPNTPFSSHTATLPLLLHLPLTTKSLVQQGVPFHSVKLRLGCSTSLLAADLYSAIGRLHPHHTHHMLRRDRCAPAKSYAAAGLNHLTACC
jgi:hypothetical protein